MERWRDAITHIHTYIFTNLNFIEYCTVLCVENVLPVKIIASSCLLLLQYTMLQGISAITTTIYLLESIIIKIIY